MDSITHLALGAAIGEAVMGRRAGHKAAFWGAVCATLPDMEVFIPHADAVAAITYHRSYSHSIFVLALVTPLLAWLIGKFHPRLPAHKWDWYWLVFLIFETHALLDGFTVYGTQLLWPFYDHAFSGSTIFIIDPAYTLPLIAGVIAILLLSAENNKGRFLNYSGLLLSSVYLAWTVGAKFYVENKALHALEIQGISYNRVLATPTPFNSILWRFVVMADGGYYEGFYSILDRRDDVEFDFYRDEKPLLSGLEGHWPVQRLIWFTHGFYSVVQRGSDIIMSDLRMGVEPDYAFKYKVAEKGNPHPLVSTFVPGTWRTGQLERLWSRLKNPQ